MSNAIIIRNVDDVARVAKAMSQSGYFQDAKDAAQAAVKIMAGQEMAIGAFAAMTGIHIIKGKPVLGANLIASKIKNDPRYNYKIKEFTSKSCVIEFYEDGELVGESSFSIDDAKAAGLKNDNWSKYPKNMLFARAISNGAKWFTPGIFGGAPVYTPDEFDIEIDEEGDPVIAIEAEARDVNGNNGDSSNDETDADPAWIERPIAPENLKAQLAEWAKMYVDQDCQDAHRKMLASHLGTTFSGDDTKRYEWSKYYLGAASTKEIDDALVLASLKTLFECSNWGDIPSEVAIEEVKNSHAYALKNQGQQELL